MEPLLIANLDEDSDVKITRLKAQYDRLKAQKKMNKFHIRVSDDELQMLDKMTSDLSYKSRSELIRNELIYKDFKDLIPREIVVVNEVDPELLSIIKKTTNNLNQAIHLAHISNKSGQEIDLKKVLAEMQRTAGVITSLLDQ
ncbi:hypothetical protein ACPV5R_18680 [Vibrio astriarenae]